MRPPRRFIAGALLLGCATGPAACDERTQRRPPPAPVSRPPTTPALDASVSKPKSALLREQPAPEVLNASELPDEARSAPSAELTEAEFKSKLVIDEPQVIGPRGTDDRQ